MARSARRSPQSAAHMVGTLLAALALVLTGCADEDPATATATKTGSPAPPPIGDAEATEQDIQLTDADVSFLQGMIPHHAQAVTMAQLVPDRTARPDELTPFAEAISGAQQPEIDRMNELLDAAGEERIELGDAPDEAAHGGHDDMAGMMSDEDLRSLEDATGDDFDQQFLELMIIHHEGAIESAEEVLDQADGNAEVADLASSIIAGQQAEVEQMRQWQTEWAA